MQDISVNNNEPKRSFDSIFLWLFSSIICGVFATTVYTLTLTPTIPTSDGGELIAAAWLPGITHAPGFPLWTMLGWLASHFLRFGDVVLRLNWLSAFLGGITVIVLFWILKLVNSEEKSYSAQTWIIIFAATLSFAFSRTFWGWSTLAEVYALHMFILALTVMFLLAWDRSPQKDWFLIGAALCFGLGFGNHNISMVLVVPAILYLLWQNYKYISPRLLINCALALGGGLLIYLYLPVCASHDPLLNWGDPSSFSRFWWHITGKQYQVNILGGGLAALFTADGQTTGLGRAKRYYCY